MRNTPLIHRMAGMSQTRTIAKKPDLDSRQLAAVALLLSGMTQKAVAKRIGVGEDAISYWVNHNFAFQAELRRRQETILDCDIRKICYFRSLALNKLRRLLDSKDEQVALGAAKELTKIGRYAGPDAEVVVNLDRAPIMNREEIVAAIRRAKEELAALQEPPPIEARDAEVKLIEAPAGEAAKNDDQRN